VGRLRARFRNIFLTGLFVTLPVFITGLLLWKFFVLIDDILGPIYTELLRERVPGLGFLTALVLIFLIGLFATNVVGRRLLGLGEAILRRIPIAKGVYNAVKQLVDAFSPNGGQRAFKQVVLVEYPRPGVYAFGFLTDETVLEDPAGGKHLLAVYLPTNNLYLGEIVLFAREQVTFLDLTIEEGMRVILSAGIATPPKLPRRGLDR
jgi:uncharacterized membrane protein